MLLGLYQKLLLADRYHLCVVCPALLCRILNITYTHGCSRFVLLSCWRSKSLQSITAPIVERFWLKWCGAFIRFYHRLFSNFVTGWTKLICNSICRCKFNQTRPQAVNYGIITNRKLSSNFVGQPPAPSTQHPAPFAVLRNFGPITNCFLSIYMCTLPLLLILLMLFSGLVLLLCLLICMPRHTHTHHTLAL